MRIRLNLILRYSEKTLKSEKEDINCRLKEDHNQEKNSRTKAYKAILPKDQNHPILNKSNSTESESMPYYPKSRNHKNPTKLKGV